MFNFFKKKNSTVIKKIRKENSEIAIARQYLEKMNPTLLPRDGRWNQPFNYIESSQYAGYTRYHFCEGIDKRIIYIALCEEEREKVSLLFNKKMSEAGAGNDNEFVYRDSLRGMFVGKEIRHRFVSTRRNAIAFMSDTGEINIPSILSSEDMD